MDKDEESHNNKKIIHIDMDAFYASVEQRDDPTLKGKPIAIGSDKQRGVVATASYEARQFGVRSAMSSIKAKKLCPQLTFVRGNMNKYQEVSLQIHKIFHDYTDIVEPLSLDEAFLDVTKNKKEIPSATVIAKEIMQRIESETKLTASAGVSYNKFLAKIASDYRKPNGIFIITPDEAQSFINKLKVDLFYGVGKVTAEKMHKMGIFRGEDLKKLSEKRLTQEFGKSGSYFYKITRGIDSRSVNPNRKRKSIGGENTFLKDYTKLDEMLIALEPIAKKVFKRIKESGKYGKTLTLKVKFDDFTQITRSRTLINPIFDYETLWKNSNELLQETYSNNMRVRLLGISVSNFLNKKQKVIQLLIDFKYE